MIHRGPLLAWTLILASNTWATAQFVDSEPKARYTGDTVTQRWRVGVVITGGGAALRNVTATTSALADWDDQKVRILDEDLSPGVRVTYRMVDDAVQQMIARIPSLAPGREAKAVVTFEVERSLRVAPEETDCFRLPDPRKLDRKMRPFLSPSPYIESSHPQIKALAQQIGVDEPSAWARVEAIYDWVRQTIEYQDNQGRRS